MTRAPIDPALKLALLFIVLAAIPLAALGWLGVRLVEQDRLLDHQQTVDRLREAASLVARDLDQGLGAWDDEVDAAIRGLPAAPPPHATLIVFDVTGVTRVVGEALPYYPAVAARSGFSAGIFQDAEAEEYRSNGDLAKAEGIYRRLATMGAPQVRAEALMRLARCLRRSGRDTDALAAYQELAALGGVPVAGSPSILVGHGERLSLFRAMNNHPAATREADALRAALDGGPMIDRATFDVYRKLLPGAAVDPRRLAVAEAAEELWALWQEQDSGRTTIHTDAGTLVSVWHRTSAGAGSMVGPLDLLTAAVQPAAQRLGVRFALDDPTGGQVWGPSLGGSDLTQSLRETGVPWSLRVAPADPDADDRLQRSRRALLFGGFAVVFGVIVVASGVVYRSVTREVRVAKLQSEFVAAVSHEFRTPLTAMRYLTDMLEEGTANADRLPTYYHALGKDTRRLQRMVETLLDFGRMESGRREYQMEETDATELAQQAVEHFREQASSTAHPVHIRTEAEGARINADRDAMALALRNLLDNAVKYSPPESPVTVSVDRRGARVGFTVEDRGPGIPPRERRAILRRFVRGSSAKALNVKGTGIGLAMVDRIARAHGGRLELWSRVGSGSRFTIVLPVRTRG